MKKIMIMAVFASLTAASCKKSYTCNCTTTDRDSSGSTVQTYTYKNSSTVYSEKMSKKQAEAACKHEEQAVHSTYSNWFSNNGSSPDPKYTTTTSCQIN